MDACVTKLLDKKYLEMGKVLLGARIVPEVVVEAPEGWGVLVGEEAKMPLAQRPGIEI